LHVLLVDDDEDEFVLLQRACDSTGLNPHVGWCANGAEALDYLKRHRAHPQIGMPNLVVLDLYMPLLDGIGFLEAGRGWLDDVSVVVLTSVDDADTRARAFELGATAVIDKANAIYGGGLRARIIDLWLQTPMPVLRAS
jgi:CheY-like chemotaxis protein